MRRLAAVAALLAFLVAVTRAQDGALQSCKRSTAGEATCRSKPCDETGALGVKRCTCECCNGQEPECAENCYFSLPAQRVRCDTRCRCGGPSPTPEAKDKVTLGNTEEPWCVSTSWLSQRGLLSLAAHNAGVASVLCVHEELPCATAGHVLRECEQGRCRLVTYKTACSRTLCERRKMRVSRLRHSADWENFVVRKPGGGTWTLTSLSVNAKSSARAPSRLLAAVGHMLIRAGLASVCDAAQDVEIALRVAYKSPGSVRARKLVAQRVRELRRVWAAVWRLAPSEVRTVVSALAKIRDVVLEAMTGVKSVMENLRAKIFDGIGLRDLTEDPLGALRRLRENAAELVQWSSSVFDALDRTRIQVSDLLRKVSPSNGFISDFFSDDGAFSAFGENMGAGGTFSGLSSFQRKLRAVGNRIKNFFSTSNISDEL